MLIVGIEEVCLRSTLSFREKAYRDAYDVRIFIHEHYMKAYKWWTTKRIVYEDEDGKKFRALFTTETAPRKKRDKVSTHASTQKTKYSCSSRNNVLTRLLRNSA